MNRKAFFLIAVIALVFIASSCRSRQPHCPGVYSKAPITNSAEKV